MPDPAVQRAATCLASHAVLLLGVGVVTAIGALAGIVAAVRAVARYQHSLRRGLRALVRQSRHIAFIDRALARAGTFVPRGYLVLHLALGLALTTAASVFFVIAEDVIAGGRIAMFDVAFEIGRAHV